MSADSISRLIEGRHHPLVKELRGIVRSGDLRLDDVILLETTRLIEDALRSGIFIPQIFLRTGAGARARDLLRLLPSDTEVIEIANAAFDSIGSTEASQGVFALAEVRQWSESDLFASAHSLILVAAGIQDPGNLGSMIRSAEAFGATGVLMTRGTVSPYNAKVIRASAGSLLRLPLLSNVSNQEAANILSRHNVTLLSAVTEKGTPLSELSLKGSVAIAIGSEGSGLPPEIAASGHPFTIPISARVESLNAAAAATIVLYEVARQRSMQ